MDVSLSFGARCPYESDCLLTETHVSYSLLRQEFQFVGLLSARLDPQNIFPLGPSLPVSGDCVCEFVEQFQFFTAVHLRLLARAHGVRFTSRTRRDALLDLLRLHTLCSCRSPPVLHFRRSPQPRQNVLLVLLAPPPLRPGPERSRNLRLSNRTSYGRLFDPLDRHPRHCCNVILVRPRVAIPLPAPFFLAARRSPSSPHVHHSSLFNRVCLCFRRAISRYWLVSSQPLSRHLPCFSLHPAISPFTFPHRHLYLDAPHFHFHRPNSAPFCQAASTSPSPPKAFHCPWLLIAPAVLPSNLPCFVAWTCAHRERKQVHLRPYNPSSHSATCSLAPGLLARWCRSTMFAIL
jgi:hypothetical protein